MQTLSGSQVRTLSPVLTPPPVHPSCVQMGGHCLDLTATSVAPVFVTCLSHYKVHLGRDLALFTVISQSLQLCLAQSRCHMTIC